jgi:phospholipase/carboxylesterase
MHQEPELIDDGPNYETAALIHRVSQPDTPGPQPTVVMIHGHLGNEDVMWIFARTLPDNWLVVSPRAIVEVETGQYTWHPRQQHEWPTLSQFDVAVDSVTHFINVLPQLYDADPDQIYLMGFSQGAAVAYATAINHPGLVKGIAGLVGFMPGDVEEAIANAPMRNLPVFMAVGTRDEHIPLPIAHKCAEMIRAAGAYLTYLEYDTGHKLNGPGLRKLTNWWAEQT